MRIGNLQSSGGRMQEALEMLQVSWMATREHWQDQQAQLFEEKYLKKINEEFTAAFPAISQVSQAFGAAERDCSE